MLNHLIHILITLLALLGVGGNTYDEGSPAITDAPVTTIASTTPMRPTPGECGGSPCSPNCTGDEVQVTSDEGVRICFHIEGDGYRILD